MSTEHTNAVVFMCSDGRLHHGKVNSAETIREYLSVDYTYLIAIPGPDGILTRGSAAEQEAASSQFNLLKEAKSPVVVAVVGHCNCAGNPVSDDEHRNDIKEAVNIIRDWGYQGEIVGLLQLHENDASWPLEEVVRLGVA